MRNTEKETLAKAINIIHELIDELKYNPQRDSEDADRIKQVISKAQAILTEISLNPEEYPFVNTIFLGDLRRAAEKEGN
ncbi:MAG TPA: hypothetical protein PKL04_10290 [Methanofastidiosum sp.]|nr:hypothetical protein [Methanofastidiosum sp.]